MLGSTQYPVEKTMLSGFYKYQPEKHSEVVTAQDRRTKVVKKIDDHVDVLQGRKPAKGVSRLSRTLNGERHVWLLYSNRRIPLNGDHDTAILDAKIDELVFWKDMRAKVLAGEYDRGIEQRAKEMASMTSRTRSKAS